VIIKEVKGPFLEEFEAMMESVDQSLKYLSVSEGLGVDMGRKLS
jgi:hypothetical protein